MVYGMNGLRDVHEIKVTIRSKKTTLRGEDNVLLKRCNTRTKEDNVLAIENNVATKVGNVLHEEFNVTSIVNNAPRKERIHGRHINQQFIPLPHLLLFLRQFFHFVLILFLQITCRRDKRFVILINPLPITEHFINDHAVIGLPIHHGHRNDIKKDIIQRIKDKAIPKSPVVLQQAIR